jgi:hypothetical protein
MGTFGSPPPTQITNGIQLTTAMVGPPGIGFFSSFRTVSLPPRGFWRGDTPSEFVAAGTYVYNNNPTNYGGTVGGSPVVIDGFTVPAGTMVVQFTDFSNGSFFMSDGSNYLFRGCKIRAPNTAPGNWNCSVTNTGGLWIHFCDLGGLSSAPADFCEVPIDIQNGASLVCYRNRMSFMTTGIQCELSNFQAIENYITDLTDFGNGTSHLNGMTINGNVSAGLILRNYVVVQQFDTSNRQIVQTDCISYFQDFGTFPGNGTNADGSTGYFIDNNYLGGTGYCIYAGKNAGSASNSVNNMHVTNNLITTQAYSTGGFNGPIAAEPVWGTLGNVVSNNRWADGASQGQIAFT